MPGFYCQINPSIAELLTVKPELIILHRETPVAAARAFFRALPAHCRVMILFNTNPELSLAVIESLPPLTILLLHPSMLPAEALPITRHLKTGTILALKNEMPLKTRLAVLKELPDTCFTHIDSRILKEEIPLSLQAIPTDQMISIGSDISVDRAEMVAKHLKETQFIGFGPATPEKVLLSAVRQQKKYTGFCYAEEMPVSVIKAMSAGLILLLLAGIKPERATEVAKIVPSGVYVIISKLHSHGMITAIASAIKPGVILLINNDVPEDKILSACRALRPETVIRISIWMNPKNSLRIARALNSDVQLKFDQRVPLELQLNFTAEFIQVHQSFEPTFFPARHELNARDLASIYSYIDLELSESGTFYDGFNQLEDARKLEILDYLLQKNTIPGFVTDPLLESIAANLDGGAATFNTLETTIKKIVPLADISDENMQIIKAKIISKLEILQKQVEDNVIGSFELV